MIGFEGAPEFQGTQSAAAMGSAIRFIGGGFALWWMGEVIELLGRIARNGETATNDRRHVEKPSRAELEGMLGSGKPASHRNNEDNSSPPSYSL